MIFRNSRQNKQIIDKITPQPLQIVNENARMANF